MDTSLSFEIPAKETGRLLPKIDKFSKVLKSKHSTPSKCCLHFDEITEIVDNAKANIESDFYDCQLDFHYIKADGSFKQIKDFEKCVVHI